MEYQCDCVDIICKEIKEKKGAETVRPWQYPSMSFVYRWITKDGELSETKRYEGRDFDFCPFCGKKMTQMKEPW